MNKSNELKPILEANESGKNLVGFMFIAYVLNHLQIHCFRMAQCFMLLSGPVARQDCSAAPSMKASVASTPGLGAVPGADAAPESAIEFGFCVPEPASVGEKESSTASRLQSISKLRERSAGHFMARTPKHV